MKSDLLAVAIMCACLSPASALASTPLRAPPPHAAASLLRRSRIATMQDSGTKITIRKPGSSEADANGAANGAAKVSVRVRPKGERKADATPPSAAVVADDTTTTVTVRAPDKSETKLAMGGGDTPSLESKNLTASEQLLLEGTTKANCTLMLEALQQGANPNVRDPKGRTPLHFVAGLGLAPAAVLLIHFGAQLDVTDGEGLTPMHMAAGYANSQTLRVLVAAGANPEVVAQKQGQPVQIVLQLGAYQLQQFQNRTAIQQRLKKKDEKLEKLKDCLDIFDDVEATKAECDWDAMLQEVLQTIAVDVIEQEEEPAAA